MRRTSDYSAQEGFRFYELDSSFDFSLCWKSEDSNPLTHEFVNLITAKYTDHNDIAN